ncbi:site-specific integrase [Natrinema thermotolerans]|uniref:Site-specific integrase n=1 Tax=Natrinema thermotolerans TaxID=121872 RepID=A0AAF0P7Z6_9EURY|nr:site-specific integrase [Natrinema thermotolerans]QCC60038.1 recombinase XerD [Natrinema thermotolerans]QCC61800.1 recombinase XerD [Natrinema thermotolerans]WMT07043.1 site-specific integrase [Natrinema thermotolerans]
MTGVAITDAVDTYIQRKAVGDPDGSGAGAYASNAESILRRWAEWLETDHGIRSIDALAVDHMRAYAAELRRRTERGQYTASTAGTYYAVVRAFLSWCVRGGILETNPAATDRAEAALPAADARPTSDSWTADQRRELERHVRERALESGTRSTSERRTRLREYAMVAVLAHSTVRGSELFRVPDDDRRTGATWDDVDFYTGTIRVLGKSQRLEDVPLPARARTPLRRYRIVLDPPANDWPLFPTGHAPSIARRVRTVLAERGHDEAEIESLLESATARELARERAIAPPAITTEGARSVLRRLCEAAGLEVDGDYLTPRGVRGDRIDDDYRQEATASKPTLRASVLEQSIAVPPEEPLVVDAEPVEGEESSDSG